MDKGKLYDLIDQEEDMTDQEKRDAYFSEIDNMEQEERWEDEQSGAGGW